MTGRHSSVCLAAVLLALACTGAAAGPSQLPLLHQPSAALKPNLVYTLDDSGSMAWRYLPDAAVPLADEQRWQQSFHPGDGADAFTRSAVVAAAHTYTTREGDLWSSRMRSAAYNRLYYDPEVRYRPWPRGDGTRLPDADPQAARRDPLVAGTPADGGAVQLTGEITWTAGAVWCRSSPAAANVLTCDTQAGERFAPATYYAWNGSRLDDASAFTRVRIMDAALFRRGPARTDCSVALAVATCTRQQEYQNFANWFSYYRTRLYAAIGASSEAFAAQGDSLRLGYGRLGQRSGDIDGLPHATLVRGVRPFEGADRAAFFTWLHAVAAQGNTPLRRALDDVGQYFMRSDTRSPWGEPPAAVAATRHAACRRSYHVLATDGLWNGEVAPTAAANTNVDGAPGPLITSPPGALPSRSYRYQPGRPHADDQAGTLADVASFYFNRDLRPDLDNLVPPGREGGPFWQNVTVYTVGFGLGGTLDPQNDLPALTAGTKSWPPAQADTPTAVDDLWHAAVNGGGRYLNAMNATAFSDALGSVFAEVAAQQVFSAGLAVSGRALGLPSRTYRPSYVSDGWRGDVQAHAIDTEGVQGALLWSAAARLPTPRLRNIWVASGSADGRGAVLFDWPGLGTAGLQGLLGASASPALVDYLRGDRTVEQSAPGGVFRSRVGALGDIVNAQPLVVQAGADFQYGFLPAGTPGRDSYRTFLREKAARAGLVFFGANDGMLHAVQESDGVEVFAFIPAAVLPRLADLASPGYTHRFYVDGPLAEGDAWWGGRWHNVLLGSTGAGAPAVFALDVADPGALRGSSVLWEFGSARDAELGNVLAAPETGLTRDGQWVAVFGNGFGGASGRARLYIVNLQTGALVRSIDAHGGPGNGLGGVRVVRDGENRIVGAYAGDLGGNLWRFDLAAAAPAQWRVGFGGLPLFTARDAAGLPQAITAAPEYLPHPQGGLLVLAGTGRLFEDADVASAQVQSLYGLWDPVPAGGDSVAGQRVVSAASLASHRFATATVAQLDGTRQVYDTVVAQPVDWPTQRGWKLPLPASFRDLYGAVLQKGFVRFRVVAPAVLNASACVASPPSAIDLHLNPLTGGVSSEPLFDTNGDGLVNQLDTAVAGVRAAPQGRSEIRTDARGRGKIIDAAGKPATVDYGRPRLPRAWRQIVNFPQ